MTCAATASILVDFRPGVSKNTYNHETRLRREDAAPRKLIPMLSVLEETVIQNPGGRERAEERPLGAASSRLIGRRLGFYRIDSILGQGSMACVYKAEHLGLHRPCALKILDTELFGKERESREQFWAEARAAANLVHPHVVTVHNLGSVDGYHYIEMEHITGGQTLRETLVREGPLEPARAAVLTRQVVLALGAAHDSGLVHRDIKPANVLLTPGGDAKLADFGLVRRLAELVQGGAPLAGTPTFMAPELFQGTPASPRSDFYAVGVLLFHTLSGRLPLVADNVGQLIQLHRSRPVPDIREFVPNIPAPLAEILARCLAKSPEERYATAAELVDALQVAIYHLRDTETLVREIAEELDGFIQGCRDTFRLILRLPGDRLQEVIVESSQGKNEERLLSVFSVCGPADPAYYEYALRLNSHLTYGSISVHNVLETPMFVMSRTFLRDTVSHEDLRHAVVEIARRSDRIEKQLTSLDQY
jgi:serine/threonine-protein kinase